MSTLHGEVCREEVGDLLHAPEGIDLDVIERNLYGTYDFLKQVNECLCFGGAYSLADSLQTLETHTGVLRLEYGDRKERLIDAISTIQEVDESDPTYLLTRFDFLSELLVIVLEPPDSETHIKPDIKVAEEIFTYISHLSKSSFNFTTYTKYESFLESLCQRLSQRLDTMEFREDEGDWVGELYKRLRKSYQGHNDYKGNRFAQIFLSGKYTHRSKKSFCKQI